MDGFSQSSLHRSGDSDRSHGCTFFGERCGQPQKSAPVHGLPKSSEMKRLSVFCLAWSPVADCEEERRRFLFVLDIRSLKKEL